MQKESIDLMNVEYEDVLHLYRGWRRSESALKDKDKELAQLKSRIKQLQESHERFRSQIQALESVKELTVTLQNQLSSLQQENKQLSVENRELAQLNLQAEQLIKDKEDQEMNRNKMLREVQIDFATLKGKYEETLKSQRDLEKIANDEQAKRISLESRLIAADKSIQSFKEENRALQQKLDSTLHKLSQCDHELLHASEQLSSISKEVVNISTTKEALSSAEAEIGVLKGDITRLLRVFENCPSTKDFCATWLECGGLHFVGVDKSSNQSEADETFASRTNFDKNNEESALSKFDLTSSDFAHLKRIHGRDPFPVSESILEESEYWVPKDAARLGMKFMASKFPHASPKVIMDFLRNMNKIWLKRERRKVKRVKEVLGISIEDLKRQLSNSKPYKGVIAERQIKRLKSQVKTERSKTLKGRARRPLEEDPTKPETFEDVDFDYSEAPHERRLCKVMERSKRYEGGEVTRVSTEKLLEASLLSLENISQRKSFSNSLHNTYSNANSLFEGEYVDDYEASSKSKHGDYPNPSYLRGALWLGRNMTLISEELVEKMYNYRTKVLSEVTEISKDENPRRSCHRLTILSGSAMNYACTLVDKCKESFRDILKGTSELEVGDSSKFQNFLKTLPIESALTPSNKSNFPKEKDYERAEDDDLIFKRTGSSNNTPNRSIRFSSILDSPLFPSDLTRSK